MTSKEVQKKFIMERGLFSSILSLYEDNEVCEKIDCEFYKSFQPIARPTSFTNDYNHYSETFRNHIYDYLYGDKDAKKVLKEINNISKTHSITLFNNNDNSVGISAFFIILIISSIMLFSLMILRNRFYQPNFKFLTNDQWVILIIGCVLIIYTSFTGYGEANQLSCKMRPMMLSLGYAINIFPILNWFIKNQFKMKKINGLKAWITSNKKRFFTVYMAFNIVVALLGMMGSYNVVLKETINGNNYKVCRIKGTSNSLALMFTFLVNAISMLYILVMSFKEMKIKREYKSDMISIMCTMVVDILIFAIMFSFFSLNVKSFITYFNAFTFLFIAFSIINYLFLFGYRILMVHINQSKTLHYTQKKPFKYVEPVIILASANV